MPITCSDPVDSSAHISQFMCTLSYAGDVMYEGQRDWLHVPDFIGLYNSPTFPGQPPYLNGTVFVSCILALYIHFVLIPSWRIASIIKKVYCGQMPDPKEQRKQVIAVLNPIGGTAGLWMLGLWFSCFAVSLSLSAILFSPLALYMSVSLSLCLSLHIDLSQIRCGAYLIITLDHKWDYPGQPYTYVVS